MPDITMCAGAQFLPVGKGGELVAVECFRKNTCYRFTAKPNEHRQSYFVDIPVKVVWDRDGEQTQQCDELSIDWDAMLEVK